MCTAPLTLGDGTQIACRECWQCRKARVDDLVGRGIAELKTAHAAHAVTLTYGRDMNEDSISYGEAEHERAVVLTYSDVQKFLKLLRRHGYPCRYLVTGEYGTAKGRAHWHIILFWEREVPPGIRLGENWHFQRFDRKTGEPAVDPKTGKPALFWPHGHTFWAKPGYEAFRYNLKYVLKQLGPGADEQQMKKQQSRMPPLGAAYFAQLARRLAEQGLAPRDGFYTFPEALRRNGERVKFRLSGRSEELFVEAYLDAWKELHGKRPVPYSPWLDERMEAMGGTLPPRLQPYRPALHKPDAEICAQLEAMLGVVINVSRPYQFRPGEFYLEPEGLAFDERLNSWYWQARDGVRWHWRYDDKEGHFRWLNPELERKSSEAKRVWQEAVSAARQTSTPWLLDRARFAKSSSRSPRSSGAKVVQSQPVRKQPRR